MLPLLGPCFRGLLRRLFRKHLADYPGAVLVKSLPDGGLGELFAEDVLGRAEEQLEAYQIPDSFRDGFGDALLDEGPFILVVCGLPFFRGENPPGCLHAGFV